MSSALIRLPGSTIRRLSSPSIGAVTSVHSRFSWARSRLAMATSRLASASL